MARISGGNLLPKNMEAEACEVKKRTCVPKYVPLLHCPWFKSIILGTATGKLHEAKLSILTPTHCVLALPFNSGGKYKKKWLIMQYCQFYLASMLRL